MNKIQEIISKVDFADLVSKKTTLVRTQPDRYKGLSPFTNEKTPSFFINTHSKIWYCFSLGSGGGVIDYVKRAENLDDAGAIQFLAELTGVELDDVDSEDRLIKKCLAIAQAYFRKDTESAKRYMLERGFNEDVVDKYELGFIGDGYGLIKHLEASKIPENIILNSGICRKDGVTGRLAPRFYNRVMIPIRDAYGTIVSFTGRDVTGTSNVKYMHGPTTKIFKKREIVWNLSRARNDMIERDMVVVCEGQMDAIAVNEAGFPAVATLGTNLSAEQIEQVAKHVNNVYILFDSDSAGEKGLLKAFKLAQESNIDAVVYSVVLPADKRDPEEFLKEFGADEFGEAIRTANSDTSAIVRALIRQHYKDGISKASIAKKVLFDLREDIKHTFTYRSMDLIERVAQEFSFNQKELMDWLKEKKEKDFRKTSNSELDEMAFPAPIYERRLLLAILDEPKLFAKLKESGVSLIDFQSQLVSKILGYCDPSYDSAQYFDVLKNSLYEEEYYKTLELYSVGLDQVDFDSALQVMKIKTIERQSNAAFSRFLGRPHNKDYNYVTTVRDDIIKAEDRIVIPDEYE